MPTPSQQQQPTAPPPEEGPRSFGVFFQGLGQGEAEVTCSTELFELTRRLQEEVATRGAKVKGSMTIAISFEAEPEDGLVKAYYDVKVKAPKPKHAGAYYWLTKGGNLSTKPTKDTKQTGFPFRDVANAEGVPHDLDPDHFEDPREV